MYMHTNHLSRILLTQHQEKMLKIITAIASALEATLTARTPFAPPHKRVHHVATDLVTEARFFEYISTPVRCTRTRNTRFFPEDEIPVSTSPRTSPRTPFFHHQQRKRVRPTIDIEAARAHSFEKICTPVRYSRKSGNRFSGELEIAAAVSKLPSKRAHGMVTRSMAKRLPVVFLSLP